jgi:hypothetical protein
LWSKEYFKDIYKILNDNGIILSYCVATPVRLSMYENNIFIYQYKDKSMNKITIATKSKLSSLPTNYKYIDMVLKQQRNPKAKAIID